MAKIKWSGIGIVDGRGKINGTVLSKNRGGAYARVKVTPNNPRSAAQQFVRSNLAFLAQKWKTLTQNERDAWGANVSNYTRTDIFGDIKTPTGYNLYMRINTALRDASTELFFNIPAPAVDVVSPDSSTLTATVSSLTLETVFPEDAEMNGYLLIDASPPLSQGVNTAGSRFKRIANLEVLDFSDLTNTALFTAYSSIYGAPVEGQKIFVRFTVMMSNGQRGVPRIVSAISGGQE